MIKKILGGYFKKIVDFLNIYYYIYNKQTIKWQILNYSLD